MALPLPPLHHPTGGPPPHAYGAGRKSQTPTRPTPDQTPKSSLSRSDREGDRSRSEWWRGADPATIEFETRTKNLPKCESKRRGIMYAALADEFAAIGATENKRRLGDKVR